ncbi:interferon-induced GTP-binding protein Mx3-like [Aplochiton taeniatus]
MDNTLNEQYEEKVRPCIDLIDSLRSLGVEKDLSLPAIAVIGDQSSGKSSVLEALSGVALPRGSGIVTRCPLELKMKRRKPGEKWQGKIKFTEKKLGGKLWNPYADAELASTRCVPCYCLLIAQDRMAGIGVGISEDLISLEISSPDVPDLTLIDLPGIARVAVKGQPQNIGEQIKKLIEKIIKRQETISLVVVPSNVDIATTEALKMAQEVDPKGERTLGILTKPDLVDKGTEENVVEVVNNKVIPLTKGYMIVKCRGQKEIMDKVSLSEATERERIFFKEHNYFSTLYADEKATIPKLAEKLTEELVDHIQKSLPRLELQIEEKIAAIYKELDQHGTGPPSDPALRLFFLIDKVTAFNQDAINLTTGDELKTAHELNIFSVLREEFGRWNFQLLKSGEEFNRRLEQEVAEYEKKFRGRELPGFINYKTFEGMMKDQIRQLEEPAVMKLKDISDIIKKGFLKLAQSSFKGFPNLVRTAKRKIETIKLDKESKAESMLRTQFKMELIVYTQDRTYSNNLKKRKLEIASQRLADQIPLVIRYQMMEELAAQLQREMLQLLQDKENMEHLLKEESGLGSKRDSLQDRLQRLMKARTKLAEF